MVMSILKIIKIPYVQVLLAIILAVIFGQFNPDLAIEFKPLGDIFIKMIKMLIGPLIFCTIVSGIVGGENVKMGRLGLKMIIYFEILTTLALIIGLTVVKFIKPGAGMNINLDNVDSSTIQNYTENSHHNIIDFITNIVPNTITSAFANGEVLPILFIAILFGFALAAVKEEAKSVIDFIHQLSAVVFKIVGFVVKLAPIGAFGAMAFTIGKYGTGSLVGLGTLLGSFYLTCIIFIFLILGLITKLCGINIWQFLKYIKEEIFLVLGTSSSESALPSLMHKLEKMGCQKSIVGITIPAGYSFNLDGTCIYFTMAIIFIAQAMNIDLSTSKELWIILILLITSKGAAGVTGSGFVTLAATLSVISSDIPLIGLTLILGIDRFMSEARSITNLIGNAVATLALAKWEGKLDQKKMKEVIN
jgi:aerobic C4-dicarboxylate transport protein